MMETLASKHYAEKFLIHLRIAQLRGGDALHAKAIGCMEPLYAVTDFETS